MPGWLAREGAGEGLVVGHAEGREGDAESGADGADEEAGGEAARRGLEQGEGAESLVHGGEEVDEEGSEQALQHAHAQEDDVVARDVLPRRVGEAGVRDRRDELEAGEELEGGDREEGAEEGAPQV